jgi:hypothetical protein
MNIWNYSFLIIKLVFSLLNFLVLFILSKIFVNKLFSIANSSLTIFAVVLLIIALIIPGFNKPEAPKFLSFTGNIKNINLTQETAKYFLLEEENNLEKYKTTSQGHYLNLSNLAIISEDEKKADHFLKMARYINPNIDFIE